eukprot:CAMPEP_0118868218 /NCGR_PEP_ID=MMETSP1163-20130328/11684_1 /TAXON_ID=124430 /ORGANISM="Phaeomonas parva, Strain CCMP2877" /LENGTH=80 /DNA_ID=CAMNT_0006802837 /DNA_START=7 /DNA_END=246 /DNA_ORIENTATION=-
MGSLKPATCPEASQTPGYTSSAIRHVLLVLCCLSFCRPHLPLMAVTDKAPRREMNEIMAALDANKLHSPRAIEAYHMLSG